MRRGFTLVELLIVIAIIGILAAIAYPSYSNSMYKARRAEVISTLLDLHLRQERFRANNANYATAIELALPATTTDTNYNLSMPNAVVSATGYTITATIRAGGRQVGDTCNNFVINQNGPDTTTAGNANAACWGR